MKTLISIFIYTRCCWYNKVTLLGYTMLLISLIIQNDYSFYFLSLGCLLLIITSFGKDTLDSYFIASYILKKDKKSFMPKYDYYCNIVGVKMAKRELEGKYF